MIEFVEIIIFLVLPVVVILWFIDKRRPRGKEKTFFQLEGAFDLRLFGWNINPWLAIIFGASTFMVNGNIGGTLQPMGGFILLLGIIKLIRGLKKKQDDPPRS